MHLSSVSLLSLNPLCAIMLTVCCAHISAAMLIVCCARDADFVLCRCVRPCCIRQFPVQCTRAVLTSCMYTCRCVCTVCVRAPGFVSHRWRHVTNRQAYRSFCGTFARLQIVTDCYTSLRIVTNHQAHRSFCGMFARFLLIFLAQARSEGLQTVKNVYTHFHCVLVCLPTCFPATSSERE